VRFAAPAKFDFAKSRNPANIYSINRPPQMTLSSGECRLKLAVLISRRRFAALAATGALALTFSRANTSILLQCIMEKK